jgi:branched-chain amino acid transport system substrate-binding protein
VQFEAESELPFVRSFAQGYQRAYGDTPDAFAAQGFDAANLVLVQLAHGRDTRRGVREGLLGVRGYPGVTGILSMGPDGNAHKRPFLLAVQHGHFVPLE